MPKYGFGRRISPFGVFVVEQINVPRLLITKSPKGAQTHLQSQSSEPDRTDNTDDPIDIFLSSTATRLACLRRAGFRAVRTKYAAMAGLRFEHLFTVRAFIEENARIRRHFFRLWKPAIRACKCRFVHLNFALGSATASFDCIPDRNDEQSDHSTVNKVGVEAGIHSVDN